MKLYPFGTFPTEPPAWFSEEVAAARMNAAAIPLWHLEGPDGEILEADALKGEMAPDYVPLPGDGAMMLDRRGS